MELRNLGKARADFEKAGALEPADPAVQQYVLRSSLAYSRHGAEVQFQVARFFGRTTKKPVVGVEVTAAGPPRCSSK